jgi:acyl carrier protein
MRRAVEAAYWHFGALHGVIHAAGIVNRETFTTLDELDQAGCELHFRAKVDGARTLAAVLRGHKLDFCLLISSLSTVLGGIGYSAYAAANLFMDVCTRVQNTAGDVPWLSLNLDAWSDRGTSAPAGEVAFGARLPDLGRLAITPAEGVQVFERALSLIGQESQIVVSTTPLTARLARWAGSGADRHDQERPAGSGMATHARPKSAGAYVAPRDEVESRIAAMWEQSLGVAPVGIHDSFLDLGGHSLLAVHLIQQVRDALQVEMPLQVLFEAPTVADLAARVREMRAAQEDTTRLDILKFLSTLSDGQAVEEITKRNEAA